MTRKKFCTLCIVAERNVRVCMDDGGMPSLGAALITDVLEYIL